MPDGIDEIWNTKPNSDKRGDALRKAASTLGIDPADLGTIISFETGGTFDPNIRGGEGNNYVGLIQFGPTEQKLYYKPGQTFEDQVNDGVVRFFQDRFKKAGKETKGATLEDLYTTVIAGNPNANRDARDSFGTSARSGTQKMFKEHRPKVLQMFFGNELDSVWGSGQQSVNNTDSIWNSTPQNQTQTPQTQPVSELSALEAKRAELYGQRDALTKQTGAKVKQSIIDLRPQIDQLEQQIQTIKANNPNYQSQQGDISTPKPTPTNPFQAIVPNDNSILDQKRQQLLAAKTPQEREKLANEIINLQNNGVQNNGQIQTLGGQTEQVPQNQQPQNQYTRSQTPKYQFEIDGKTPDGLNYLGQLNGKYRFNNADGDEFELDETSGNIKSIGFPKKLPLADGVTLTKADENGNYVSADGKKYRVTRSETGQFSATTDEQPAWVTGKTKPTSEITDKQLAEAYKVYTDKNGDYKLEDTEELRQHFLNRFNEIQKKRADGTYNAETDRIFNENERKYFEAKSANRFNQQNQVRQTQTVNRQPVITTQRQNVQQTQTQNPQVTPNAQTETGNYSLTIPKGKPETVSAKRWITESIALNLASKYKIPVQGIIEYFEREGFFDAESGKTYRDSDFLDFYNLGDSQYVASQAEIDRIINFAKQSNEARTKQILQRVGRGDKISEQEWQQLDPTGEFRRNLSNKDALEDELSPMQLAEIKGGENRKEFENYVNQLRRSDDEWTRTNAVNLAKITFKWLSPQEGQRRIDLEKGYRENAYNQEKEIEVRIVTGYNQKGDPVYGYRKRTEAEIQEAIDERMKRELEPYGGNISAFVDEQARMRKEYSGRSFAGISETLKTASRYVAKIPATVLEAAAIANEYTLPTIVGDYLTGKDSKASNNILTKWAKSWRDQIENDLVLKQNPDVRNDFIVNEVGKGLGQLLTQVILAPLTGGYSWVLPIMEASTDVYKQADKSGAGKATRLLAAVIGGAAAIPDVLLQAKYLRFLSPSLRKSFVGKLSESLFANFSLKVGREEAKQLTRTTVLSFIKNGAIGFGGEFTQEAVEDLINQSFAKLTYNPNAQIIPGKDQLRGYLAAGIVGAFGGQLETATQRMTVDELIELQEALPTLLEQGRLTQFHFDFAQRQVQKEIEKRNAILGKTAPQTTSEIQQTENTVDSVLGATQIVNQTKNKPVDYSRAVADFIAQIPTVQEQTDAENVQAQANVNKPETTETAQTPVNQEVTQNQQNLENVQVNEQVEQVEQVDETQTDLEQIAPSVVSDEAVSTPKIDLPKVSQITAKAKEVSSAENTETLPKKPQQKKAQTPQERLMRVQDIQLTPREKPKTETPQKTSKLNRFEVVGDKDGEANVLISATDNQEIAEKAQTWAKQNGFSNVRVSDSQNLEKPDFAGTVNIPQSELSENISETWDAKYLSPPKVTNTGRAVSPIPKIDDETRRKGINTKKRFDKWLIENAVWEAQSRNDDFNLRTFESLKDKKLSPADRETAYSYLFDEDWKDVGQTDSQKSPKDIIKTSEVFYVVRPAAAKGNSQWEKVSGEQITLKNAPDNAEIFLHKKNKDYIVSEATSGGRIALGGSRAEAIQKAENIIKRSAKPFKKIVAESVKKWGLSPRYDYREDIIDVEKIKEGLKDEKKKEEFFSNIKKVAEKAENAFLGEQENTEIAFNSDLSTVYIDNKGNEFRVVRKPSGAFTYEIKEAGKRTFSKTSLSVGYGEKAFNEAKLWAKEEFGTTFVKTRKAEIEKAETTEKPKTQNVSVKFKPTAEENKAINKNGETLRDAGYNFIRVGETLVITTAPQGVKIEDVENNFRDLAEIPETIEENIAEKPTIKEIADASPNVSIVRPDTKPQKSMSDIFREQLQKRREAENAKKAESNKLNDALKNIASIMGDKAFEEKEPDTLKSVLEVLGDNYKYYSNKTWKNAPIEWISIDDIIDENREGESISFAEEQLEDGFRPKTPLSKPIEVYRLEDGKFEIVDGNHRVAKARAKGWTQIEAKVLPDPAIEPDTLKSVLPKFDQKTYDALKPNFDAAFESFADKTSDINEQMGMLIDAMTEAGFSLDTIEALEPYFVRFMEDKVNNSLQTEENKSKTELEAKDNADRNESTTDDQRSDDGEIAGDVSDIDADRSTDAVSETESPRSPRNRKRNSQSGNGGRTKNQRSGQTDAVSDTNQSTGSEGSDSASNRVSRNSRNYLAPQGSLKREGSWKKTAENNLDIIELVKKLEEENRVPTTEEQALLVKFTGWGASELANGLFPGATSWRPEINLNYAKPEWRALAERAKNLFTADELKTAIQSTQYAHYTSEAIIRNIWNAFEKFGFRSGTIFEPGMGIGLFPVAGPRNVLQNSVYTGIEREDFTARIAKLLMPDSNIIKGDYTQEKFPDDYFDIAIGNPPFSDTKILSDPRYKKYKFFLHDYFFAKTIDKVRPGGLLVFVSSKGTLDKKSDRMRQYIAERADFVGAVRLPQTAFKENAGTEVVTDVIFLRKRLPNEEKAGKDWLNVAEITIADKNGTQQTQLINEYFVNNPEMVLGTHALTGSMYRANEYTVEPLDGDIENHFAKAIENLPSGIFAGQSTGGEKIAQTFERDFDPKEKKEGLLYVHDNGKLMVVESGAGVSVPVTGKTEKWLKDYVGLRDALKTAQKEQQIDGEWQTALDNLNKVYEAFVKKHGYITAFTLTERQVKDKVTGEMTWKTSKRFLNNSLLKYSVESALIEVLEDVDEKGNIVKGEFLLGRTINKPQLPEITSLNDALGLSLNQIGKLNLDHIIETLKPVKEITKEQLIEELGDLIYEVPGGSWILADEYLSGKVVDKLEEAQAAARLDPRYERNVAALQKVQPKPVLPENIDSNLGSNLFAPEIIEGFAREILGLRGSSAAVAYKRETNEWAVSGASGKGSQMMRNASHEWGTDRRSPHEILETLLNSKKIKITDTIRNGDGSTTTVPNPEATAAIDAISQKMRMAFKKWVWSDATRASELAAKYNSLYNRIVRREYDGEHLKVLPGLSMRYDLYGHQKRVIWRIIQTGNTYLAHSVGAGKTLEMIVAGMEQKRLGLISKPMYVVPKWTLEQWGREFLDAYPLAKVLVAKPEDLQKENRKKFIARAALNDWDAIIIAHSSFEKIQTKPETNRLILDNLLRDLQWELSAAEESNEDNPLVRRKRIKEIEGRIEKIEQKFFGARSASDEIIDFEDLGVDFLFIDEAHAYRKLDFVTNRQTKGIDPKGSQRALDLQIKMNYVEMRRPGRSAVLASGTPMTNTLAELYTLQKLMQPRELEAAGLEHFDAWANQYGEEKSEFEQNAAGKLELVTRFSEFVNVPELMKTVSEFMDVLTTAQLGELIRLPKVEGGEPRITVSEITPPLKDYLDRLDRRIEQSKAFKPSFQQPNNPDPLINIITDARLASFDMRFIEPSLPSEPQSKLNVMIDSIIKTYNDTKDTVYYDRDGNAEPIKGSTQIVFSYLGFGKKIEETRGFSAKKWMVKRLSEAGIPREEIAFMEEYQKPSEKEALFADMRSGKKKILIGSPSNMGTGVNVQKRLKHLHYAVAPWNPTDVEQPDGRILRQGNQNDEIIMERYAVKGTYDSTNWQMLARKSRNIKQVMTGDDSVRRVSDVGDPSQYEMASALSAGDPRFLELAGIRRDIEKIRLLRSAHHDEQQKLQSSLQWQMTVERTLKNDLKNLQDVRRQVPVYNNDSFNVVVAGKKYDSRLEIGEAVIKVWAKAFEENKEIAKIDGKFGLFVTSSAHWATNEKQSRLAIYITPKGADAPLIFPITDDLKKKEFEELSPTGLATRIYNAITGIDAQLSELKDKIERIKEELEAIRKKLGKPFEQEQELFDKIAAENKLQLEIANEGTTEKETEKSEEDNTETDEPTTLKSVLTPSGAQSQAAFFSQLERVVEQKMPNRASAAQIRNILTNPNNQVKQEEYKWLGMDEYLSEKDSFTKDEILEFVRANNVQVEEVVKSDSAVSDDEVAMWWIDESGANEETPFDELTPTEQREARERYQNEVAQWTEDSLDYGTKFSQYQMEGEKTNYREIFLTAPNLKENWKDGHGDYSDVKNPVIRLRIADRADADGAKVLFIEEIQPPREDEFEKMPLVLQKYAYHIGIKHAMRIAAEGDYDKILWTPGEVQADRYSLATQVEQITYDTIKFAFSSSREVNLELVDGNTLTLTADSDTGKIYKAEGIEGADKEFKNKTLAETIGKDLAKKILETEKGTLDNEDLKVGGTGLRNLYDVTLPNISKKFTKKFGAKVGTAEIATGNKWDVRTAIDGRFVVDGNDRHSNWFDTKDEAEQFARTQKTTTVHALDITPQMRESVLQGQPLFRKLGEEDFTEDEKMTVEEMRDLPFVSFDELLPKAEIERFGDRIKANAASHEIFRRTFEAIRVRSGQTKVGALDAEDLFKGVFLKPEAVRDVANLLREKAREAKEFNYTPEEVAVFNSHATLIEAAAAVGKGTVAIYVFESALPEELFHQADYLGAAEKTILNRHSESAKKTLDNHKVTQILTEKHFGKFNEYKRQKNKQVLNAIIRAEIPPILLELTEAELKSLGITEDMRDDYLLTWFEGYAERNGIDALDNFEKEEINVQEFIKKVKESQPKENGQIRGKNEGNNQIGQRSQGTPRGSPQSREQQQTGRLPAGIQGTQRQDITETAPPTQANADTQEFFDLGPNQKLASLPATMRRAGLEAADIAYEVFGDKAAVQSAMKMLDENGIQGAIQILRNTKEPDVDHAILSFMIQRVLIDNAAQIQASNPALAQNYRETAINLGREHALRAVAAGRFTRAASIIQNSVEGVMYAAQGIIEEKHGEGKTLSPAEWDRIETAARNAEEALAKVSALEKDKRNLQAKIKRLKDKIEGKTRKRKSKGNQKSRQKLVELVRREKQSSVDKIREKLLARFTPLTLKAILAWHGSPHRFDKFDISKIGTGEGAQIYGYGLYFTDKESIADWYKNRLAQPKLVVKLSDGEEIASDKYNFLRNDIPKDIALKTLFDAAHGFNIRNTPTSEQYDRMRKNLRDSMGNRWNWSIANAMDLLTEWQKNGVTVTRLSGAKYKVELAPKDDEYLLWDKPLSEQSEKVKKALEKAASLHNQTFNGKTGEELYKNLVKDFNFKQKQASEYLHRLGIRGIKYLDGTSRSKGEGSYNYVIFDDKDVEVVEILKSVLPKESAFDEETLDEFAEVGALLLTEGLASDTEYLPEDFYAEMMGEFGDIIGAEFQEIYIRAWKKRNEWLNEMRFKQTQERIKNKYGEELEDWEIDEILGEQKDKAKRRRAVENLHKLASKSKSAPKNIEDLKRIIADVAPDENSAIGAILQAENLSAAEIYRRLKESGITDESAQRNAMRNGKTVLDKAKIELKAENDAVYNELLQNQEDLRTIDDLRWQAREKQKEANSAVAQELRRLRSGELSFRGGQIVDASNAMRTMMASFDMSGALRQGGFFSLGDFGGSLWDLGRNLVTGKKTEVGASRQAKAFASMFKSISEKGYGRTIMDIENHPRFVLAQRAGLDFAEAGKREDHFDGEELYRGKEFIHAIPVLGPLIEKGITNWSERTYTAFLDQQRMIMFNIFAEELMANGLTFQKNANEFKAVAEFVNIGTGRGTMPTARFAKLLMDLPFFAPRYTLSRLQLLNKTLNPVAYYNLPPATRKIVAKSAVRFYGTTAAVLGIAAMLGASVSLDDDDDDFLKIKIGDTRYDIFAGTLQPAKLIIKIVHAAIRGDRVPGEMSDSIIKAVGRFVRGKLSPAFSLGTDWMMGADYVGNKFSWGKAIGSRLMPLLFSDAVEAYKLNGVTGVARSVPLTFFGVGVSNYKDRPEQATTEAEKLTNKIIGMKLQSKPQTEEEKKQRDLINDLTARSRNGEDISKEVNEAVKSGKISEDQKRNILNAKYKTYLEDKAEGLSLDELEAVFNAATPKEREILMPMLNEKMKNAGIDKKLKPEQRKRLENLGARVVGDFPMPDAVRTEFEKHSIKTPDVGEQLVLQKGEKATKLSPQQYEKYRRETLEKIYGAVDKLVKSDRYKNADAEKQQKMIEEEIRKQRTKEQKETKKEVRKAVGQ